MASPVRSRIARKLVQTQGLRESSNFLGLLSGTPKRSDLEEFVTLFNPANRQKRKASLNVFWLKDERLADRSNLPPSEVVAQEIVDDLEAALEQFRLIAADLGEKT